MGEGEVESDNIVSGANDTNVTATGNVEQEEKKDDMSAAKENSEENCVCVSTKEDVQRGLEIEDITSLCGTNYNYIEDTNICGRIEENVSTEDTQWQDLRSQLKRTRELLEKTKISQESYSSKIFDMEQTLIQTKVESEQMVSTMETFKIELCKSKGLERKLLEEVEFHKAKHLMALEELQKLKNSSKQIQELEADLEGKNNIIDAAERENKQLLLSIQHERELFRKEMEQKNSLISSIRNESQIFQEAEKKIKKKLNEKNELNASLQNENNMMKKSNEELQKQLIEMKKINANNPLLTSIQQENKSLKEAEKKYLKLLSDLDFQNQLSCYQFSYYF